MSKTTMADVQAFIDEHVNELQGICADVTDVNLGKCGDEYLGGFSAWSSLRINESVHERSIHGHGVSLSEAYETLRKNLAAHQKKLDSVWQCCVDGCSDEAVVTTGDGRMCAHHGMQWLASEKQAAEESA